MMIYYPLRPYFCKCHHCISVFQLLKLEMNYGNGQEICLLCLASVCVCAWSALNQLVNLTKIPAKKPTKY